MKKLFLIIVAALTTATVAQAQNGYDDTKHEVAISIGAFSNSQWIDALEDATTVLISGSAVSFDDGNFTGPFSAEYFYHIKPWLGVGGIFVYGNNKQDILFMKKKDGELKHSYYTLLPAVKFDWLRNKHIGMYSKLGLGVTLRNESIDCDEEDVEQEDDTMTHFNWQLSLLGFEAGGPKLRGFVELGCGEQGIALVGVRCKF